MRQNKRRSAPAAAGIRSGAGRGNGTRRAPRPWQADAGLFDLSALDAGARGILEDFPSVIASSHPLNSRQQAQLPQRIRELSHLLTDDRGERRMGYMNDPATLSAYVHYFTWWNLVRLTRLFASLDVGFFPAGAGDCCLDIGSGPLTVPLALFLARPELRAVPLSWYCMDISAQALAFGEDLFLAAAARLECTPWKIVRVKGALGAEGLQCPRQMRLVTCANVFNEVVQEAAMPPDYLAKKQCGRLLSYVAPDGDASVLVVEPGVPHTARFVSLLRDALLRREFAPVAPCTHCAACPMDGKRGGKWCNFAFSTEDAPARLRRLSESAHLGKERAVLSFVAARRNPGAAQECVGEGAGRVDARVASDPIRLPGGRTGWYACSARGLLLVVSRVPLQSGQRVSLMVPADAPVDQKSGALLIDLR